MKVKRCGGIIKDSHISPKISRTEKRFWFWNVILAFWIILTTVSFAMGVDAYFIIYVLAITVPIERVYTITKELGRNGY